MQGKSWRYELNSHQVPVSGGLSEMLLHAPSFLGRAKAKSIKRGAYSNLCCCTAGWAVIRDAAVHSV